MGGLLDAALAYAARGWAVFPIEPRGKRPVGALVPHGLHDASRDPTTIRGWWAAEPTANIGLPTGDSFDVIDCDGCVGMETFCAWCEDHQVDVDSFPRAVTGRDDGGRHVLIAPTGAGNRTGVLEGIDYRGRGGYIVAPPSVHASGRSYAWKLEPNGSLPEIDEDFFLLLANPPPQRASRVVGTPPANGSTPYGLRALDDELRLLSTAREGERNDQLNHRAFRLYQLVSGGELNEATVETELMVAALDLGLSQREVSATMKSARQAALSRPRRRVVERAAAKATARRDTRRRMKEVLVEATDWLWRGRIPLGKVTIVDGMPGLGKSIMVADLAARVSAGLPMPDGTPTTAGSVLMLVAEDGLGDTVKPRLMAAGADLSRISAFGIDDGLPMIPDDLEIVEAVIRDEGVVLLIVDPLFAFVNAKARSISDQEMRQSAMTPLARLARQTGAAVVLVRHLSKDREADPLTRGAGSMGIIGAARSAFLVGVDPDDPDRRVLATTKANNSASAASLAFRIGSDDELDAPRILWEGISPLDAHALLNRPPSAADRGAMAQAKAFLEDALGDHVPHPGPEVEAAATALGITKRTLERARSALGVISRKGPGGRTAPWLWLLPMADCGPIARGSRTPNEP